MPSIIIDDTVPYTQTIATSGQTQFDTDWYADAVSDVYVYARPEFIAADDATQLVSPNDYNVTFVGEERYVRVTFLVGRVLNDTVTITRLTPADRDNLYTNTNFTPSMLNGDFGRYLLMIQQNTLQSTQLTPHYNKSATVRPVIDTTLPTLTAKQSWRMNDTGDEIVAFQGVNEVDLGSIPFIVQTPNAFVPIAQPLSLLPSGVMKNTTATGVVSISQPLTSLDSLALNTDMLPYGTGPSSYNLTPFTSYARTLLADATAADARTTLDVDQANTNLKKSANLSDLSNFTDAVSNLGLTIGTFTQAFDLTLESISTLGTGSDKMIYTTGVNAWAETAAPAFGRSVIAASTPAIAANTLQVLPLAGGTLTGPLILNADPVLSSEAVTKNYVDNRLLNFETAATAATTGDLTGWTYNNGTAGVAATLTAPVNGILEVDGVQPGFGERILVKDQIDQTQNGMYTVQVTDPVQPATLIRATDYDHPDFIQAGDQFTVVQGIQWGASQWVMAQTITPIVLGTTPIFFGQLLGAGALLKANNLSDLPNPSAARSNLGLAIGTNVQAYDATLQSISALGTASDKFLYTSALDTWAEADITAFGRSVAAAANAAAGRSVLGLSVVGTPANSATLVSTNAGVSAWTAPMTDGQIVIGSTGGTPVPATLTGGLGITITNGPGTVTIASNGGGGTTNQADIFMLMGG